MVEIKTRDKDCTLQLEEEEDGEKEEDWIIFNYTVFHRKGPIGDWIGGARALEPLIELRSDCVNKLADPPGLEGPRASISKVVVHADSRKSMARKPARTVKFEVRASLHRSEMRAPGL